MTRINHEGRISPSDLQLIGKEIEVQGEFLNQERLDRKADIERLSEEIRVLRERVAALERGGSESAGLRIVGAR